MGARLASHILIGTIRRLTEADGAFCTILEKGHQEGGIVHLKCLLPGGTSLLTETVLPGDDGSDALGWRVRAEAADEHEVDAMIERDRRFDRDGWVLEIDGAFDQARLPGKIIR